MYFLLFCLMVKAAEVVWAGLPRLELEGQLPLSCAPLHVASVPNMAAEATAYICIFSSKKGKGGRKKWAKGSPLKENFWKLPHEPSRQSSPRPVLAYVAALSQVAGEQGGGGAGKCYLYSSGPVPSPRGGSSVTAEEGSSGSWGQLVVSATLPVFGNQPQMNSSCLPSTSCPEDCGHEEEAAAVHRALQVAAQLPQPLIRLFGTGVRCAHKPGMWGGKAQQNQGAGQSQGYS